MQLSDYQGPPCALHVRHRGIEKLVGKVTPCQGELAFVHADVSGTQYKAKQGSPGGVDCVVLDYLALHEVEMVVHEERRRRRWLVTTVDWLRTQGKLERSDGRARVYLPTDEWEEWSYQQTRFEPKVVVLDNRLADPGWFTGEIARAPVNQAASPVSREEPAAPAAVQGRLW